MLLAYPIIVYNVVSWAYCSPALLTRLMTEVSGVIGVKQSAGDLKLLADLLLEPIDNTVIFSAVDALMYSSFCLGAHGAIAAILAAVPELCIRVWDAVAQNDHQTALNIHKQLLRIWNVIAGDNLPANVKTALALQGRPAGIPRSPMAATSPQQREALQAALIQANVPVANTTT